MTWIVWRQQRSIFYAFVLGVVALSIWMLISGRHQQSLWTQYLAAPCKGGFGVSTSNARFCQQLQSAVYGSGVQENDLTTIVSAIFAPLFGLVLGVNAVARELELKTNRLAWTQSGSRAGWLAGKYLVSLASMAIVLVPLCFVFSWWVGASHDGARLSSKAFPISGFAEIGYAILCFALVVAIGLLIRRAGWTLAIGIILFAAIFYTFGSQVRPGLVSPKIATIQTTQIEKGSSVGFYSSGGAPANSLFLSQGFEPKATNGIPSKSVLNRSSNAMYRCENARHQEPYCAQHLRVRDIEVYIPDSHFWALQGLETGFYLFAAAVFAALTFLGVRRIEA
jgi:ABC-type transport system involved in multi-copper enzyme maturation permease subunit